MADVIAAAICNGSSQQLTAAVTRFSKDINKHTAFEAYPLHLAVWRNSALAVQQLLEAGADADVRDGESGWTPLHKALHQGSLEVAALLLAYGSSMELLDSKGRLPLDLVSRDLRHQLQFAAAPSAITDTRTGTRDSAVVYSSLYSWGNGANFTLGTGSTDLHLTPTRVELEQSYTAAAASTSTSSSGSGSSTSTSPSAAVSSPQVGRVVSLAAAKFHSALVTDDGRLFTFGFGRGGRLGHADFHIHSGSSAQILPRAVSGLGRRVVVAVAAAKHHTLVATSAGEIFSFGSNAHGRLGYAAVDSQPTPKKVAALPPRVRVVAVAAANKHSAAVTTSGDLYTWGANSSGQLGYGTSDSSCNPAPRLVESLKGKTLVKVAAAKHHTVVLTSDGEVWTFGHKVVTPRKVLLAGSRDTARAAPLQQQQQQQPATAAAPVTSAAAEASSSSNSAGSASMPGNAATATTDQSGSSAATIPVGSEQLVFHQGTSDIARPLAIAIAAGASYTSCLTRTGVVLVWPSAAATPRALEVAGPLAGRRVVSLSAGKNRTAVVTDDGQVFMWESREGKKAKKKGTGDTQQQQQQQQQQVDKMAAVGAVAGGASKQSEGTKKLRPQSAATTDDQRDTQQHHVIRGAITDQSSTALTTVDTAARATGQSAANSSSSSRLAVSGSTSSQAAGAAAAGGSSVAYGSSSSSGSVPSLHESWVGPTAPVVPERVHGVRHVTAVAVGEKHSLAVQSWTAPVLPQKAQHYQQMLDFAAGQSSSGSSSRKQHQQRGDRPAMALDDVLVTESSDSADDVDSDEYTDAADGGAAAAVSNSKDHTNTGYSSHAAESSNGVGWLVGMSAAQHDISCTLGSSSSKSGFGPEPLSVICERAVAVQLVEPRTAPALLEYADMAGAVLLRTYCLSVAVRNLDMLVAEARPAFEQLPQHLLAEMEDLYRQLALKEPPRTQMTTAAQHTAAAQDNGSAATLYDTTEGSKAIDGPSQQQQVSDSATAAAAPTRPTYDLGFHFVIPGGEVVEEPQQQQQQHDDEQQQQQQGNAATGNDVALQQKQHLHLYRMLHPGLRPTKYPDSRSSLSAAAASAAAAGCAGDHALLTAAAARGALAAVHRSWFEHEDSATIHATASSSQQVPVSTTGSRFLTGDSGRLAALRAAGQKLHRNLLKKLQQIEVLESRQQEGLLLDAQQMAKLSLKGSILDALSQLRSGTVALDDIQGLITRAQAVAQKLYLTPTAAVYGDDDIIAGRTVGSYGRSSGQDPSPLAAAAANDVDDEQVEEDAESLPHSTISSTTLVAAAAAAEPSAASRKSSKKHKGRLSLFLTGELEKRAKTAAAAAATAAAEDAAASSSQDVPKGPAWGGVALQAAAAPSLRDLLHGDSSSAAAAAAVSRTQAGNQQQAARPSMKPAVHNAPKLNSAAAAASGPTTVPLQQQTPPAAASPVTPAPAVKQAVSRTPGGFLSVERSTGSSSTVKQLSSLPPVGPSGHHHANMTAVSQHQVGLTPQAANTAAAASTSPAAAAASSASGSGLKLSLMDLMAHKRSSPLAVTRSKSKTAAAGAVAGSSPPPATAAAAPAWGGVVGSSPPSSGKVSLRDIQQEQEQLRATTGWAAYQRERAAAAVGTAVGSPAAVKSSAVGSGAAGAAAPSKAVLQMKAAGGLSQALHTAAAAAAGSSAAASPAMQGSGAVLGSSPIASGSLSRSLKGGSSSFPVYGSSPPAPSKWYIRDQPQVRSLTDIQDEEQTMQQQTLLMKQIEEQRERERQEQLRKQKQQQRERREHRKNKKQGVEGSSSRNTNTKGVCGGDGGCETVAGTGQANSGSKLKGKGERSRRRGTGGNSSDQAVAAEAYATAQQQQQRSSTGQQPQQHRKARQPQRSANTGGHDPSISSSNQAQADACRTDSQPQPCATEAQHAAAGVRRRQQQCRSQHPAAAAGDGQEHSLDESADGMRQHDSRGRGRCRGTSGARGRGYRTEPAADYPTAAAGESHNKLAVGGDGAAVSAVSSAAGGDDTSGTGGRGGASSRSRGAANSKGNSRSSSRSNSHWVAKTDSNNRGTREP